MPRDGIGSGISAADRAETIRIMAEPTAVPEDLVQPGHVFPLRAQRAVCCNVPDIRKQRSIS